MRRGRNPPRWMKSRWDEIQVNLDEIALRRIRNETPRVSNSDFGCRSAPTARGGAQWLREY